jgi:hypothetical protein
VPPAAVLYRAALRGRPLFSLEGWPVGHLLVAGFVAILALARYSRREVSRLFWWDQVVPYVLLYAPLIYILALTFTGGEAAWPWVPDFIRFR